MNHNTLRSLAVLGLGFLPGPAQSHQMWIETLTDPPRTVVRFGEFGDSVEKSPGYLDQLAPVPACPAGATLLTVNQTEDLPGIHLGKRYAITSHNASLCWVGR